MDRKHGPSISRRTAGPFWLWLAAPHPFAFLIHFFFNYFLMQCVLSVIRDFTSRCRCRFLAFLLRIFPCTAACNGITTTVISAWNFRFSQTLLRIVFKKKKKKKKPFFSLKKKKKKKKKK